MKSVGWLQMRFIGEDGSMGYRKNHIYVLRIMKPTGLMKLISRYEFIAVDTDRVGQDCPYLDIVMFLQNWESWDIERNCYHLKRKYENN